MRYVVKHLYTGLSYTSTPAQFDEALTEAVEDFRKTLPEGSTLVTLTSAGSAVSSAYHLSTWAVPTDEEST